jgi:predicted RNA binding protein YcfA (HicA-like mRNA interferase family)
VHRALVAFGFSAVRHRASHVMYTHPDGRSTVVPRHAGEDLGGGLVRAILRDIRVDWQEIERRL